MPILKSTGKGKGIYGKMIGMVFPLELHTYFSLFSLAKGVTKTSILTNVMSRWMSGNVQNFTEDDLISEIVIKVKQQWEISKGKIKNIETFKKQLTIELAKKDLPKELIDQILKQIK
jgi:hypothetical protein